MNARECHIDLFDPFMCRKFIYVAKTKFDPLARHLHLKLHEVRSIAPLMPHKLCSEFVKLTGGSKLGFRHVNSSLHTLVDRESLFLCLKLGVLPRWRLIEIDNQIVSKSIVSMHQARDFYLHKNRPHVYN